MSGFLSNIIDRHVHPGNSISPRFRSLFEQEHMISHQMESSLHKFREQESSRVDNKGYDEGINDGKNREKQDSGVPSSDRTVPLTKREEDALPFLNPSSEKKENTKLGKSHFQDNSNNKPIQERIPSQSVSPKRKSHSTPSPEQKPKFNDNGNYPILPDPSLSLLNERNKERAKPVLGKLKESSYFQDSLSRLKSHSRLFSKNPDNQDPLKELQNPLPLQQKFYGKSDFRELKNENKQGTPTVRISIGRIEIKAVNQQKNILPKYQSQDKTRISLDDFLDKKGN